jgi:small GTP-binding protein
MVLKIVLLGDGTVGKTTIRLRYLGYGFQANYLQTIGADFALKDITINEKIIKAQIWDLAGQVSFDKIRLNYLLGCHSAFIVYDVANPDSYHSVLTWFDELSQGLPDKLPIVIIGNKIDLREENKFTLSELEGQKMAERLQRRNGSMPVFYIETSAKTGENIKKAFDLLTDELIRIYKI